MLNGTLAIHDIRDVEAFCTDILNDRRNYLESAFAKAGRAFTQHNAEDYITYLIERTWERSQDQTQWRTSFSGWVGTKLRHYDTVEYLRLELKRTVWKFADRTYERQRLILEPLDLRPDEPDPQTQRDHPPDRNADQLVRLLRTRSSDEAWRHHKRRKTLPHRAA
jgi:hypothetical protein